MVHVRDCQVQKQGLEQLYSSAMKIVDEDRQVNACADTWYAL